MVRRKTVFKGRVSNTVFETEFETRFSNAVFKRFYDGTTIGRSGGTHGNPSPSPICAPGSRGHAVSRPVDKSVFVPHDRQLPDAAPTPRFPREALARPLPWRARMTTRLFLLVAATVVACTVPAMPPPATTARLHFRNGLTSVTIEAVTIVPATTAAGVASVSRKLSSHGI